MILLSYKKSIKVWTSAAAAAALSLLLIFSGTPLPQAQAATVIKPQNIVATGGTITTVTQEHGVQGPHLHLYYYYPPTHSAL